MALIAVVGSINMDLVVTADRLPGTGETITGKDLQYLPGGKGANQAAAAAKLGAEVQMFGCVGDDDLGKSLLANLANVGVGIAHIKIVPGVTSGTALITVGGGDNTIVVIPGANAHVNRAYIDSIKEELLQADIIMLQHEIPQETNEYVAELGYQNGKTVILDPGPARPMSEQLLDRVSCLTPNEHETAVIFGTDADLEELLRQYPEKLIITQGDKGVSFCTTDGGLLHFPAADVDVVDTTGAGDTMSGALAFMLSRGYNLAEAVRFANYAAAFSVERYGAQTGMPTYEEVLSRFAGELS